MRKAPTYTLLALVLGLALTACSKEEAPPPQAASPDPAAEQTPAEGEQPAEAAAEEPAEPVAEDAGGEMMAEQAPTEDVGQFVDMSEVPKSMQSGDYNAVADGLGSANVNKMTPEQQAAYYQAVQQLQQKALTDPSARAAYQRYGRKVTGR